MTDMCELHLHDYYSKLDGLPSPAEYMLRAKELGMTHLSQTNHGTLGGHRPFQIAAKEAGIVPILGLEAYVSPTDRFDKRSAAKRDDDTTNYNHLTLLAQNEVGIKTLNRLSDIAWTEGYYSKPRMDNELIWNDNDGLIVLSGCLGGFICRALEAGNDDLARQVANQYKSALGGRYYIEVQGHNPPEMNAKLLGLADELGIRAVATSDCHYAREEDLWIEQAMLIISSKPKKSMKAELSKANTMGMLERFNYLYPDRFMNFEGLDLYLRGRKEHSDRFLAQGIERTDIYENTLDIADSIGEYPFYQGLDLLPSPTKENSATALDNKVNEGMARMGLDKDPVYVARKNEELSIIHAKGFDDYILIAEDLVSWALGQGIPKGPGRGSSVGSLVNYVLGITDMDPVEHGLLFFRFIDPERDDWPDIDFDFGDKRRDEVKDYATRKYKNVASIATFTMFQGKSSLKSAASVFRVPLVDVNKATKNNDAPPDAYYFDYFDVSDQGIEFTKKYPESVKLAKELYGRIAGGGMHAAGVVMANQPIHNFAPMETAKRSKDEKNAPRKPMIAYDMGQAEDVGLIKYDFLGLKALTIIDDTVKMIKKRHDVDVSLLGIDREDKNVYDMLSSGYTKGVFQCEQSAYTSLIFEMGGIRTFAELAASNALVRPGAKKTIGAEYIYRKKGGLTTYIHKDTKWFTEDTYGEVLYQEQVMLMVTELAGMSMSTANKVRKIIGKKKDPALLEKYKNEFLEGATKKITRKKAEKLWHDFEAHAGYSFNKSHAVAYSLISYWTAWFKNYYPLEFMAAVLKNEDAKSEDSKNAVTDYLIESKRLGLRILLPHVNKSGLEVEVQNDAIRLGLTNLKFIQQKTGNAILEYAPYNNYKELETKVLEKGTGLNTRVLGSLNAVGGACFEDNPLTGHERENFYEYLQIPAFEVKDLPPEVKLRFRALEDYDEAGTFPILAMLRKITKKDGWARAEFVDSTGSTEIFISPKSPLTAGQMYAILIGKNRVIRYMTMNELSEQIPNQFTNYLYGDLPEVPEGKYLVVSNKLYTTKAGKKMSHMVFADHLGELHFVMAFPQMYKTAFIRCREGTIVNVQLGETDDGSLFLREVII